MVESNKPGHLSKWMVDINNYNDVNKCLCKAENFYQELLGALRLWKASFERFQTSKNNADAAAECKHTYDISSSITYLSCSDGSKLKGLVR